MNLPTDQDKEEEIDTKTPMFISQNMDKDKRIKSKSTIPKDFEKKSTEEKSSVQEEKETELSPLKINLVNSGSPILGPGTPENENESLFNRKSPMATSRKISKYVIDSE